jgi:hypothetical protein
VGGGAGQDFFHFSFVPNMFLSSSQWVPNVFCSLHLQSIFSWGAELTEPLRSKNATKFKSLLKFLASFYGGPPPPPYPFPFALFASHLIVLWKRDKGSMIEKRGEDGGWAKEELTGVNQNTSNLSWLWVGHWRPQLGQDNGGGGGKSTGVQVRSLISSHMAPDSLTHSIGDPPAF